MPTPTEELVATISEKLKATADVKVVYGEAQVVEGKTIIPVAVASYGFGAGAGSGTGPQGEGGGAGAGGGMRVKPVGVVEITAERTRFIPIVDVNRLATLGLIALVVCSSGPGVRSGGGSFVRGVTCHGVAIVNAGLQPCKGRPEGLQLRQARHGLIER